MKITSILPVLPLALLSSMSFAQTIDVTITNLTHGLHFTPLLVSAHTNTSNLFVAGTTATAALQTMAEGGNIAPLVAASVEGTVNSTNPAGGLLAPGSSTTVANLDTGSNDVLSIVAMVLPTNDGFMGLNSWAIPEVAGTYTVYLNAYDAGTEVNDEILDTVNGGSDDGIPADPSGKSGTGATGVASTENNTSVHIHRGTIGDTTLTGGVSDLDSRIHRWLNPVAKVVVTVK
jgi:hypothetical protein